MTILAALGLVALGAVIQAVHEIQLRRAYQMGRREAMADSPVRKAITAPGYAQALPVQAVPIQAVPVQPSPASPENAPAPVQPSPASPALCALWKRVQGKGQGTVRLK